MKSTIWFAPREKFKSNEIIVNLDFDDFLAHAGFLAHTGQKFEYRQLGQGRYEGRLLYAPVGDVSIQIEYASQSLEKVVEVDSDSFTFVMSGKPAAQKGAVSATDENNDWIQVFSPNAEHVAITPSNCTLTVVRIKSDTLLGHGTLLPEVADWFASLGRRPVLVRSTWHANRLRSDILYALESLISKSALNHRSLLDKTLAVSIVLIFNQIWILRGSFTSTETSRARDRFLSTRKLLLETDEEFSQLFGSITRQFGSKRLIELAFADQVKMGPLAYARVIRLHNARRKLLDADLQSQSIGDIASEEGFWDWSRFATYYRRQFGELPSETRLKLGD